MDILKITKMLISMVLFYRGSNRFLPGLSTLITSAPRSPKFIVAKGPASTLQC